MAATKKMLAAGQVPLIERVLRATTKTETCWLFTAGRTAQGYGMVGSPERVLAHRVTYEHFVGPIPEGLVLDHLCRVPNCVNPEHLEPVTNGENIRRSPHAGGPRLERCKRDHDLSVTRRSRILPDGTPRVWCAECKAIRERERREGRRHQATLTLIAAEKQSTPAT